jgi:hypothetical protein
MFDVILRSFPQADGWLIAIWNQVEAVGIQDFTNSVGFALLLIGIIWTGIRFSTVGSVSDLLPFMIRFMIASGIVVTAMNTGDTRGELQNLWTRLYVWSTAQFANDAINDAGTVLGDLETTLRNDGSAIPMMHGIVTYIQTLSGGSDTGRAAERASVTMVETAQSVQQIVFTVSSAAIPIMAVYNLLIMISGFTVILGSVFMPIAGAMIIFPNNAASTWLFRWFRLVFSAYFIVLFGALIFSTALRVGFIRPAEEFNTVFVATATNARTTMNGMIAAIGSPSNWDDLQAQLNQISTSQNLSAARSAYSNFQISSFATVIFVVVSSLTSMVLVFLAQGQIVGFVGSLINPSASDGNGKTTVLVNPSPTQFSSTTYSPVTNSVGAGSPLASSTPYPVQPARSVPQFLNSPK